mgnify:CR=1 FL=1
MIADRAAVMPKIRPLLIILASLLAPAAAAADAPPVLRYGQAYSAAKSVYSLPVAIAEREGFFRREGLDFRIVIPLPGGADRMIAALHDDTVDVTHVATTFLVRAALAGSDAVAIAAEFNNPVYTLVARPEIAQIAELRGKPVGMADPGGSIALSMRKLFARHGVAMNELALKVIEGTPARLGCLRRGECAAVPLGQPQDLQALAEGYRALGLSTDAVPEFVYTVTAARRSWAATHRDAVVRYVRGLAAAFRHIRDPANRAAVAQVIVETTGVSSAVALRTLALYFEPERRVLPREGEIDPAGMAQAIAFMGEGGLLTAPLPPAARFYDTSYLRAAGVRQP